ncbi:MAG: hypothetical protein ACXWIN_08225 [Burkholderiaceae bacterium]
MSTIITPRISEDEFGEFVSLLRHDLRFPFAYAEWISQLRFIDALNILHGDVVKEVVVHPEEFENWNHAHSEKASVSGLYTFAIQKTGATAYQV